LRWQKASNFCQFYCCLWFEQVRIDSVCKKWSGSLQIGLTSLPVSSSDFTHAALPASLSQLSPNVTWFVTRSEVWHKGRRLAETYCPSLERINVGDVIGVKRSSAGAMHLCVNGRDMGPAATGIPQVLYTAVSLSVCLSVCLLVCLCVSVYLLV